MPVKSPKKRKRSSAKKVAKRATNVTLLVGTRKGAFLLSSDAARARWTMSEPIFLGNVVHHLIADPNKPQHLLMATRTGHLGPTVFWSSDFGRNWTESTQPPAFPKVEPPAQGRSVKQTFWLSPGHPSQAGVFYAGTSPHGLFRSEDGGRTWQPISGFNDHPLRATWGGDDQGGTPDGPCTHSIQIDPRDADHMYIGLSSGGVLESQDGGADWKPLNLGCAADFLPNPDPEYGHDPHCVRLHPLAPDVLYQQNHCGIYRLVRPATRWERIGDNMPKDVGDIGFPIVLHPRDPDTAWVFPMDGTSVWPRTSPDGKPAVYVTRDAGRSWQRQDRGLPKRSAYLTVLRQSMNADGLDPLGLYFGTTSGELWASKREGGSWRRIAEHLPNIYSIEAVVH